MTGRLAAFLFIACCLAATALTFTPAIAGPPHHCRGYMEIKPRNQMSDLYGGAITQWLPRCRP